MIQQDSFGNLFHRRMVNGQQRTRPVETQYPIKHLSFKTPQGGGHEYDWCNITLRFIVRVCNKRGCMVCDLSPLTQV